MSDGETRKKIVISVLVFTVSVILFLFSINVQAADKNNKGWENADKIVKSIVVPAFPDKNYDITSFGAVGDGKMDCLPAIKQAIDKCNIEGGGRVVVPSGNFFVKGPIHLKSHVNLHLDEGAVIKFSSNPDDYLPVVLTRWEGTECYNYSPFIYAFGVTDIAITGKGTIDGNARDSFATWKPNQSKDQLLLRKMGNDGTPVNERVFGKDHFLRPVMIQPYACKNILIEGVKIIDSPFWEINPVLCYNVTVRNVKITSWNLNNDGCDPEGTVNVLIENCEFNTGDDAIAIKAGRDQDAWRIGQATENVVIRNCVFNSKANGLCIGSEMSGGVRNVYMENIKVGEANATIYFKSNLDRGGFIENIWVRNVTVKRALQKFIAFVTNYHGYRGNHFPPIFKDFTIENITCTKADDYAIFAEGVKDSQLQNVLFKNIKVGEAKILSHVKYAEKMIFDNVTVNGKLLPKNPIESKNSPTADE